LGFQFSWQKGSLLFLTLLHHNLLMLQHTQGKTNSHSRSRWPALCALALGALAAYSAIAWVLQIQSISVAPSPVQLATQKGASSSAPQAIQSAHVAAALGAPLATNTQTATRANVIASADHQWTLLGVVAGASGQGSALLAVDGQPPKAYRPGQAVAPGWVLHSVGHRLARLSQDSQSTPSITLELPKPEN
jgi:general secretion pathway protein C